MKSIRKYLNSVGILLLSMLSANAYSAESSLSFYGLLDVYAASSKGAGADKRTLVINPSGMTTSYIGVSSKIDMGSGLTGVATLESFLRPDTGEAGRYPNDQFFARDAFVGVEGGFGKVYLGRNTTPYFISVILTNPFVGSFGFAPSIEHSFLGGLAGDSGWSDSVLYNAPSMGGVDISLLYATGEVAGSNGINRVGGNVFYRAGKFTGTFSYQNVDLLTWNNDPDNFGYNTYLAGDSQAAAMLGVTYDLSVVKLFGQLMKMKTIAAVGDEDWKTIQLGVTVPVAKGDLMASFAHTKDSVTASDTTRKTLAIGYNHPVNKKVDLYIVFNRDDISSNSSAGNVLACGGRFQF